jgi:hypothetical protein
MSDDHGTFNLRHRVTGRDLEALRQRYLEHKQLLDQLVSDAPTEVLAERYRQVSNEIALALKKLDELERAGSSDFSAFAPPLSRVEEPGGRRTAPGMKPLRTDPQTMQVTPVVPVENTGPRTVLILGVGVLVLVLLGFFLWRFATGGGEAEAGTEVTDTSTAATAATAPVKPILSVEPLTQDYGTVRRGTRATRQFELLNSTDQPLTVRAERSQCRCLWFEYADTIPPQGSTTITVTVDGSKAAQGPLHETVRLVSRADPNISTDFEVLAQIR